MVVVLARGNEQLNLQCSELHSANQKYHQQSSSPGQTPEHPMSYPRCQRHTSLIYSSPANHCLQLDVSDFLQLHINLCTSSLAALKAKVRHATSEILMNFLFMPSSFVPRLIAIQHYEKKLVQPSPSPVNTVTVTARGRYAITIGFRPDCLC